MEHGGYKLFVICRSYPQLEEAELGKAEIIRPEQCRMQGCMPFKVKKSMVCLCGLLDDDMGVVPEFILLC